MKSLIFTLLLMTDVMPNFSAVVENVNGRQFLRIYNNTGINAYCFISSPAGHFEFAVPAHEAGRHYPITGDFHWACN